MKRKSDSYRVAPVEGTSSRNEIPSLTSFDGGTTKTKEMDTDSLSSNEQVHNSDGIHWAICAMLIVGEMAGGGLVALPGSMVDAGIVAGTILTLLSALTSGYTGVQLGDNWIMMQKRWPEYHKACKKPYPEMAYRAIGKGGRVFVSALIAVQQFGLAMVFLLLASNNISSFLHAFWDLNINFCYVALIVAGILWPFLMLESPKDFWQAGVAAMISTTSAVVLIFIGAAHDQKECMEEVQYPPVQFNKFFLAYGTIMFAYGGHSCFPTFQHDMKRPQHFGRSVIAGYCVVVCMYLPVSIYGYLVYGGSLHGTITESIQLTWVQQAVNILITVHVMFTQMIVISPLSLEIESFFGITNKFGIGRVVTRTLILVAIVIVAMTIPRFGPLLDLVGGSTITLMTMLLPGIFYLSLNAGYKKREDRLARGEISHADNDDEWPTFKDIFKYNNKYILALNAIVLTFGFIGGIASTVSAVIQLTSYNFVEPCYIQIFRKESLSVGGNGLVHCCGRDKNIVTISGMNSTTFCATLE